MGEIKDSAVEQAEDLRRVVRINEDIKGVIRVTSEVNIAALNAMLIAKRAGEQSRGFGVVSSELRIFSGKLERYMDELGTQIAGMVGDVAMLLRQCRMFRYFTETAKQPGAKKALETLLAENFARLERLGADVREDWRKLSMRVQRALHLCEIGVTLSRSAKIEAVYGGDLSVALKQVAGEIEAIVNRVLEVLKGLKFEMAA